MDRRNRVSILHTSEERAATLVLVQRLVTPPTCILIKMHRIALLLWALTGASQAQVAHMMRFACSQLTVERLDRTYRVITSLSRKLIANSIALVNPGQVGTPHTHQIV